MAAPLQIRLMPEKDQLLLGLSPDPKAHKWLSSHLNPGEAICLAAGDGFSDAPAALREPSKAQGSGGPSLEGGWGAELKI